jgi:deazaflavin-dependent oxidoreductase (nitroreductase family)
MAGLNADTTTPPSAEPKRAPRLPPRWFIRTAWVLHRAAYRITRGRLGLRSATADRAGYLRLRTVGRRTRVERRCILGYLKDGPNLFTLAMNGWGEAEPAWWLNLQADPDAVVDLADGSRGVVARAANTNERSRLWARLGGGQWGDLDGFAARRSRETAIVILEPRG